LLIETYKAMGMTIEPTQEDVELWMEMADLDKDGKVYLSDYEDLILRSLK
jgi:Ca2+-binding EF-hand superfamily protein